MAHKKLISEEIVDSTPKNSKNSWVILLIIGLLLLMIIGCIFFWYRVGNVNVIENNVKSNSTGSKPIKEAINPEELNKNYAILLDEIKNDYNLAMAINTREEWSKFSYSALDKMFNAVITAENKELHLKLIISLNSINKLTALKDNDKELNEEIEKLKVILEL